MPCHSCSTCATHGSAKNFVEPLFTNPQSIRGSHHESNPKESSSSNDLSTNTPASASPPTNSFDSSKAINAPAQTEYSLAKFKSDAENPHPKYQYSSSGDSTAAYIARITTILNEFDATYEKK